MVRWAESQKGRLFANVSARQMIDQQGKANDILAALRQLKDQVKAGDYAIVYLSGHGGTGNDGKFHFCAHDRNLGWAEMQQVLRQVPGTVIVILDACHAGGVSSGDNLIVFSAALRNQTSLAGPSKDHNSLYTEYLLKGLKGAADMNKDGFISLAEIDAYVSGELANKGANPPTLVRPANVPSTLPLARLAAGPVQQVVVLANTTWSGTENFPGYNRVTPVSFRFSANGSVEMTDAEGKANGQWTRNGNNITLTFQGVATYRGTINGSTITGQGQADAGTWAFTVNKK
jgi:hypothetical protein